MLVLLVMGRSPEIRNPVAIALARALGSSHVQVADELAGSPSERVETLRARMASALEAGRTVVYSAAHLSATECRALREAVHRIELVRLLEADEKQPPIAAALTLDGSMEASVIAATIVAVFRLDRLVRRTS